MLTQRHVLVLLFCCLAHVAAVSANAGEIRLSFDAPVPGTITDVNGNGTGFTCYFPETGANLPVNDPKLMLDCESGYLNYKSTYGSLTQPYNLDNFSIPCVTLYNVVAEDFRVSTILRGVHLEVYSTGLQIVVGKSTDQHIRGGLHWSTTNKPEYGLTSHYAPGTETNVFWQLGNWANGHDVEIAIDRTGGTWGFSWRNLTNGDQGQSPRWTFPYLDDATDLYCGLYYQASSEQNTDIDEFVVTSDCIPVPCPLSADDFAEPMGKKKQIGSTIPVKFQLYFDEFPIQSQKELDAALAGCGRDPACPEIVIWNVTDAANAFGIELPEDGANVGEGGDLGFCFRFADDGTCIYNLRLSSSAFQPNSTYLVEVRIGGVVLQPGNSIFQTK